MKTIISINKELSLNNVSLSFFAYEYDDLNETAKMIAVNECIRFMIETFDIEHSTKDFRKAVTKSEDMHTPWFLGEYVWEYCKKEVLLMVHHNLYDKRGKVIPIFHVKLDKKSGVQTGEITIYGIGVRVEIVEIKDANNKY